MSEATATTATTSTAATTAAAPTNNANQKSSATILCVDDELNILSAMKRLFRPSGYRVITADSGAKGLELIEQEKGNINVVISDMRMPNMNGAEFLTAVRQKYPDIMRILLTGYSDMDSTVDAINDGQIYRYVSKPWNEVDLISCVKEALKVQHLKAEKERLEQLTQEQNVQLKALNATLEEKVARRTADLRTANDRLKRNLLTTIKIFSSLIELRGGKVAGHSRRTAELARKIAVNMKLSIKEINDIFLAGLLHDIGKIGLSDELLNKPPVKMTPEERKIFCEHPTKGEELLMPLEDMRGAAAIILSHHEHFDGKGYPEKLAGEQIPLGARILAVANEHDGLVEGYLTGKKETSADVRKYIHNNAGKRYDPNVVAMYEKLVWDIDTSTTATATETASTATTAATTDAEKSTATENLDNATENSTTPYAANSPHSIAAANTKPVGHAEDIDPNKQSTIPAASNVDTQDIAPLEEFKDPRREMIFPVLSLRAGMQLSRDLFSANGTMLLAADFVLDDVIIKKLSNYMIQHREHTRNVFVYEPDDAYEDDGKGGKKRVNKYRYAKIVDSNTKIDPKDVWVK